MHRIAIFFLLLTALAAGQSLGDAARAARAKKPQTQRPNEKVFTNESLSLLHGSMSDASVKGGPNGSVASSESKTDAMPADKTAAGEAEKKDDAAAAEEQKKQLADDITKTKAEIDQLTRELDVAQRENRLRAATYYADAGNRLRNEKQYAEDDRRYQADIQGKQAAIAAAKQKLAALEEQQRRSGAR